MPGRRSFSAVTVGLCFRSRKQSAVQTTAPPAPPLAQVSAAVTERGPGIHSADGNERHDSHNLSVKGNILGILVVLGSFSFICSLLVGSLVGLVLSAAGVFVLLLVAWMLALRGGEKGPDVERAACYLSC